MHYGMWGWVAIAFASAGAALSAAELLSREQPRAAAPPGPQRLRKVRWHPGNANPNPNPNPNPDPNPDPDPDPNLRKVRWHLGNSKASLALAFVFAGSAAIVAGKTLDQANKGGWGVGWVASDDRHGRACGPVLTIVRPQSAAAVPCVRVRVAGTRSGYA